MGVTVVTRKATILISHEMKKVDKRERAILKQDRLDLPHQRGDQHTEIASQKAESKGQREIHKQN